MAVRPKPPTTAVSPDPIEDTLFRAEMDADGVTPLAATPRAQHTSARPKPLPLQRNADENRAVAESLSDTSGWDDGIDTGDLISFLRPGLPSEVMRKLKRGQWVVQDRIDLHGMTLAQARDALGRFLAHARHHGVRCVLIIHGKGYRSPNGESVLRNKVRLSLSRRDEVLAFCDAIPADGGSGAVLVLLRG